MRTISLGPGLAPDVMVRNGQVFIAFGTDADLQLLQLDAAGDILVRHALPGFFNSFPRFAGPWLVYKAVDFTPRAVNIDTGQAHTFQGRVDGNWGIVANALERVAWQTDPGLVISIGDLSTGSQRATTHGGAPDGLELLRADGSVLHRKDIRVLDPAVGGYAQRAGDLMVGQYGFGIGVRFDGDVSRWLLGNSETMDPRCATDGTTYAIASWGNQGVRLTIAGKPELQALRPVPTGDEPAPPQPVPTPVPTPTPQPEPPMSEVPAALRDQAIAVLEQTARRFPVQFNRCHAHIDIDGNPNWPTAAPGEPEAVSPEMAREFIQIAAYLLHTTVSPRFGMNGKRGNPNDPSMDVVAFMVADDPADVRVIDVVANGGISKAYDDWLKVHRPGKHTSGPMAIRFMDVTQFGPGFRIVPTRPAALEDEPTGPPPLPPPPSEDVAALKARIVSLEAQNAALATELDLVKIREHENVTRLGSDVVALTTQRDALQRELTEVKKNPCALVNIEGPGWARQLFGITCRPK